MPKNKSYDDRKKILNQMFRTRAFTLQELILRVEEKLGKSISKKTIQNDIRAIKEEAEQQEAELKCENSRYFYEPRNFNLFEVKVNPDTIERVKLAASILKQIPGLDLHEELSEVFEKYEMRVSNLKEDDQFIQFDTRPDYTGAKYLSEILESIKGETVIQFAYQPFTSDTPIVVTVHPYLLKEWNNRWFLIGLPEHLREKSEYEFHQYGLERIQDKIIPIKKVGFYRHHRFDETTFYKNVIGVTVPKDAQIEKVILRFSLARSKYVETNPLHRTQKTGKVTKIHKVFSYDLILNPELETIILSYGSDVEVIEPETLKVSIGNKIKRAMDLYF